MTNLVTKMTIWGAAAALAMGGFAVVAQGQGPGGGRGFGDGPLMGLARHMLDLTDAQQAQIKAIAKAAFDNNQALAAQLKAEHEAERAAIKAGKSDGELAQLAQSYAALHTQMHAVRLQTEAKIYKVLTPEQQAKAEKIRDDFRGRAMQRFGHRRPGGAPPVE